MRKMEKGARVAQILNSGITLEKLAEYVYDVERNEVFFEVCAEMMRSKCENLRGLCKHLYVCKEHAYCRDCPYHDADCDFRGIMREQGIEVE